MQPEHTDDNDLENLADKSLDELTETERDLLENSTNDTEPDSVTGAAVTMGRFKATGPRLLGARKDKAVPLPVNSSTDKLVARGLLERVE